MTRIKKIMYFWVQTIFIILLPHLDTKQFVNQEKWGFKSRKFLVKLCFIEQQNF